MNLGRVASKHLACALAGEISGKGESSIQMRVIVLQLSVFAATIGALESVGD